MKPFLILLAMVATALGQQQNLETSEKATAADITRGRAGGDGASTSTSVRIEGNANQGAGVNTLAGETSNKTLRIDPAAVSGGAAVSGTSTLTVTGASSAQPAVQPTKTSGTTSPANGATDTGPGAER